MKRTLRSIFIALFALAFLEPIFAQLSVTVSFGPPALPVYDQPICPGDGYLWVPGYWAYDPDDGYYWVPGTWVEAPEPGYLWTPGWWGWENGGFLFHEGFWATEVGFYGGIYYGFGYFGEGFQGGRWDGGHFFYNRAVMNVDVTNIHNVYNTTIVNNVTVNRVSYNGGEGGITARPTNHEQEVERQQHIPPIAAQTQHMQTARSNPQMRAEANHGRPPVAATSRPGEFSGRGIVAARAEGAPYHPAPSHPRAPTAGAGLPAEGGTSVPHNDQPTHARDLQPHQVQPAPSSGDPRADLQYNEQQEKLAAQQNKEHQKLQQQQEKEDQKVAKRNLDQPKQQQMEQRHQQQTQQLEEKHSQQQQQLQSRQPPPRPSPRKPE
jgi:hypothetical protein